MKRMSVSFIQHIPLKSIPRSGSASSDPGNRFDADTQRRHQERPGWLGCVLRLSGKVLPCLWLIIGLMCTHPIYAAEVVDRIVVVVNDDIILLSDVNGLLSPYAEKVRTMGYPEDQQTKMIFQIREDVIKKLIDETLTDQQIEKLGLTIAEQDIDRAIERLKERRSITDEDLRRGLALDNLTMEDFRNQMKTQLLRTRLVDYEVKSKIVITNEDVKAYYDNHPEIFGGNKQYHLRNIILRISSYASEDDKLAVRKKMEGIYAQLESGENFAEMARRYSESSLAADGGDLGLFKLDDMAPILKEAIENLDANQYTQILDTDQGFQIFYVEKVIADTARALESVSKQIEQKLYEERLNSKFGAWLEDLRKRSHIKIVR